ncbi:MAG: hypothetical protein AAGI23_20245 [Bacteroidota bacterium]
MSERYLQQAIRQLPTHAPSHQLWARIEVDLELGEAIQELPTYTPSEDLWSRIEDELPQQAKVRTIGSRWWQAAAAIAILLVATFWWQQSSTPQIEILSDEMTENPALLVADWNEDEAAFARISELCAQHPFWCETATVQELKEELEELSTARGAVLQQMQKYGTQARLVHQVKHIEQERSQVLQALVQEI